MKRVFLVASMALSMVSASVLTSDACTNFLVGKNASADGSTMISYAADSYSFYGFLKMQPAADHAEGAMRQIKEWDTGKPLGEIPEVAHTYSVVGNMNEHQLSIGETTWGGRSELQDTTGVMDYGSLIYVTLQRCKTAREAIACMTTLVAEHGYYSGGESFSIADPNEIWIMELIGKGPGKKGAVWVATRIPDDCISGHANQARITNLPLNQKLKTKGNVVYTKDGNWMWEKEVITLAREKGYFEGKDADFSFQAAYNPFDFTGLYVCEARVWSFFRHFVDSAEIYPYYDYAMGKTYLATGGKDAGEHMPLYFRPNRKVSVQDMKESMRDQYEGTPEDITKGLDAGPWGSKLRYGGLSFKLDSTQYWYPRPTATQQTAWSFIAQMRGYADPRVGGIFWFGVDDAATTVHVPMYCRINHAPECFEEGNGDLYNYSPTSAWWTFNIVANWAYAKYSRMKPEIEEQQRAWDEKFNAQIAGVDEQAARCTSDEELREFLTSYSCSQADNVIAAWQNLGTYLMIKYLDGRERQMENGEFKRNAYGEPVGPKGSVYPEEYLRIIAPDVAHE